MSIRTVLSALPGMERCADLQVRAGDIFLLAAGFEDRCKTFISAIQDTTGVQVLLLDYLPFDARNNTQGLIDFIRERGFSFSPADDLIVYDRFAPYGFISSLNVRLRKSPGQRIFLDVSAMSKLAILCCLKALAMLDMEVVVCYCEAREYGPSRDDYEKARADNAIHRPTIQVYTGVQKVVRLRELSSVSMQGQPAAAIAFMSFNEQLTQALLNSVYPARLFLINGRPPELTWREEATAWIHEQLRREWGDEDNPTKDGLPIRVTSTLDYRDTLAVLLDLYWNLATEHRVLLAPTGSKMQTIACFLFSSIHPDIHIEYPTPTGFLDLYSRGAASKWCVNFGKLGSLVEKLNRLEVTDNLIIS